MHNVPVGDRKSYDNFGVIRDRYPGAFYLFYGGLFKINSTVYISEIKKTSIYELPAEYSIRINKSRYSSNSITSTSTIGPSRIFGQSIDQSAAEGFRVSIANLEERKVSAQRALDEANRESLSLNQSRESLTQRKQECKKLIENVNVARSRLQQKQRELRRYEEEAVDLIAEERTMRQACGVFKFIITINRLSFTSLKIIDFFPIRP